MKQSEALLALRMGKTIVTNHVGNEFMYDREGKRKPNTFVVVLRKSEVTEGFFCTFIGRKTYGLRISLRQAIAHIARNFPKK